jgi:hypothetical protein
MEETGKLKNFTRAVCLFTALSGWLLGGREAAQRRVLGLGTGFRSFPAALIVSVQNFTDPNVSVMVIVTTLTAIVVLLPAALLMGKHEPAA